MKTLQFLSAVTLLLVTLPSAMAAPNEVQTLLTEAQTAYMRGDIEGAKANFQMVNKLDPRNQTAIAFLRRIQVEQAQKGGAGAVEKKLAAIIIPNIEFKEATLRETLEFLRKKVNDMPNNQQPVNFVMQLPDEQAATAKVTLNLTNIPFTEVLRYIGGLAGVSFAYDKYAIIVRPSGGKTVGEAKAPVTAN